MLQQGSRSVADYAVEFDTLAEESAWNEPALWSMFHRGLSGPVRDGLVGGAHSKDLDELIDRAIEIDNHQRKQCRERFSHPRLMGGGVTVPICRTTPQ